MAAGVAQMHALRACVSDAEAVRERAGWAGDVGPVACAGRRPAGLDQDPLALQGGSPRVQVLHGPGLRRHLRVGHGPRHPSAPAVGPGRGQPLRLLQLRAQPALLARVLRQDPPVPQDLPPRPRHPHRGHGARADQGEQARVVHLPGTGGMAQLIREPCRAPRTSPRSSSQVWWTPRGCPWSRCWWAPTATGASSGRRAHRGRWTTPTSSSPSPRWASAGGRPRLCVWVTSKSSCCWRLSQGKDVEECFNPLLDPPQEAAQGQGGAGGDPGNADGAAGAAPLGAAASPVPAPPKPPPPPPGASRSRAKPGPMGGAPGGVAGMGPSPMMMGVGMMPGMGPPGMGMQPPPPPPRPRPPGASEGEPGAGAAPRDAGEAGASERGGAGAEAGVAAGGVDLQALMEQAMGAQRQGPEMRAALLKQLGSMSGMDPEVVQRMMRMLQAMDEGERGGGGVAWIGLALGSAISRLLPPRRRGAAGQGRPGRSPPAPPLADPLPVAVSKPGRRASWAGECAREGTGVGAPGLGWPPRRVPGSGGRPRPGPRP